MFTQTLEPLTLTFIISAFTAGILSILSPCILPVIPMYVGVLSDEQGQKNKIRNTILFILGISTVFLALGVFASTLSPILANRYTQWISGVLIIVFGLMQLDIVHLPALNRQVTWQKTSSWQWLKPYILGVGFSAGWTPCIGPMLASVLAVGLVSGREVDGFILTLAYTLGLVIPFLLVTIFSDYLLKRVQKLNRYTPIFKKVGGLLLIFMGILMISGQVNIMLRYLL